MVNIGSICAFGRSSTSARAMRGREIFTVGGDDIRSAGDGLVGFLIHGPAIEDNAVRWFDLDDGPYSAKPSYRKHDADDCSNRTGVP
jgi:hypothetical protein